MMTAFIMIAETVFVNLICDKRNLDNIKPMIIKKSEWK